MRSEWRAHGTLAKLNIALTREGLRKADSRNLVHTPPVNTRALSPMGSGGSLITEVIENQTEVGRLL